jgi:ribose transport system substrate-binding protein
MNLSRIFLFLGVLSTTFALPACGGGSGKLRLAFISNNPHGFWKYAQRGAQKAAEEEDVDLDFRMPSNDGGLAEQKRIIEDLMQKGVAGIAISPNDPGNFVTFFQKKVASRIPLVMADNDLPDTSARHCYIGTHNYKAGRAAGVLVKKAVPKGGKIAIFVGRTDATNAVERRQGVLDVLAGKDQQEMTDKTPLEQNVKVGDYLLVDTFSDGGEQDCQTKAASVISKDPEIKCLIGLWEYNPPALLRAVRSSTNKPAIVAFDENFATMEGIQKGEIVGTVVQNPYKFGYESIKILAKLARKDNSALTRPDIDSEKRIYIPHRVIVLNPGKEKIADAQTIDVNEFFPELKTLNPEGK